MPYIHKVKLPICGNTIIHADFSCALAPILIQIHRHATLLLEHQNTKNDMTAIDHYQNKLAYEMDPSDLFAALEANEQVIVIDARKSFAYERERIPGAINLPTAI
jgi:hypothetical protein